MPLHLAFIYCFQSSVKINCRLICIKYEVHVLVSGATLHRPGTPAMQRKIAADRQQCMARKGVDMRLSAGVRP